MLVFENRGPEVGATITHPHGQIYAFDFVPELPLRELRRSGPVSEPGDRLVASADGWRAWVPEAPTFPYVMLLMPDDPVPDLPSLDGRAGARWPSCSSTCSSGSTGCSRRRRRTCCGSTSGRSTARTGRTRGCTWRSSRRGGRSGVARYVAAGELGSGVYFNPVVPEEAARALREAV